MADQQAQPAKQLVLQKIYIKDLSFESPKAPQVFLQNAPVQTQLNIRTNSRTIDEQNFEVTLTITVESKDNNETIFLIELAQAGVFAWQGYTPEERALVIGSYCPGTLYPFAREAIADIASKGGFPQLLLQPINFDAVFAQAQQERAAQAAQAGEGAQGAGIVTTTIETPDLSAAAPQTAAANPAKKEPPQGNGGTH